MEQLILKTDADNTLTNKLETDHYHFIEIYL